MEIPGEKTHELPPLLVNAAVERFRDAADLASALVEAEDMLDANADPAAVEERKFELAIELGERYKAFISQWLWGNSILEWIRQCEITFENVDALRRLLRPDVWPHAGRASFVTLLEDKHVEPAGVALERAVGLRLAFRQPPPMDCISNQFLFFLDSTLATSAYETWSRLSPPTTALLPPDRFHFEVVDIG